MTPAESWLLVAAWGLATVYGGWQVVRLIDHWWRASFDISGVDGDTRGDEEVPVSVYSGRAFRSPGLTAKALNPAYRPDKPEPGQNRPDVHQSESWRGR
jgi:hypothetical protein